MSLAADGHLSMMLLQVLSRRRNSEHLLLEYDILIDCLILITGIQVIKINLILLAHEIPHNLIDIILRNQLKVIDVYVKLLTE